MKSTRKREGSKRTTKNGISRPNTTVQSHQTPSPTELWLENLRSDKRRALTAVKRNISTFEDTSHRPKEGDLPFYSTPHFLREAAGLEMPPKPKIDKSRAHQPQYRTPEEYYEEVREQKAIIKNLNGENSLLKTKLRKAEESVGKKDREIEQLLDPAKGESVRRTLNDRRPDSSTVVQSLKQKIMKLEQQLRSKEADYQKLESDTKTCKVEEMKVQLETFYLEIVRLKQDLATAKSSPASEIGAIGDGASSTKSDGKRNPKKERADAAKLRALNESVLRLSDAKTRLEEENKSLKSDLEKLMHESADRSSRHKDHSDMSKRQLIDGLVRAEQRLEKADERREPASGGSGASSSKKEKLLKEEIENLQEKLGQMRESKDSTKHKLESKSREVNRLKEQNSKLEAEIQVLKERRHESPPRKPSSARDRRDSSLDSSPTKRERSTSRQRMSRADREREVESLRETNAARKIQRGWRGHHDRKEEKRRLREEDDSVLDIQASLRAHTEREKQLKRHRKHDQDDDDYDDEDVLSIQSSLRGHSARLKYSRDPPRGESHSDYDEEDVCMLQSALRGHSARTNSARASDNHHPKRSSRHDGVRFSFNSDDENDF